MLNSISPSTTSSYLAAQRSTKSLFLSLPLEIQAEVENHLPVAERLNFYKALTTVTRDGEPADSPALKLHLLQKMIAAKYHQSLASSDESLRAFALNQLQRLEKPGQLHQVVEKHALFELVRRVDDPKLFGYLKEKIQQVPELKQKLLNWVERSKVEEVQTVAANALTLLVKTGVQLSDKDFSGIRVPGADLSYGMFGLTKFQNADLSGVDWTCAWLRGVNLDGADLARSQFGEKPSLKMNKGISACCYSPDGRWLAVAVDNQIQLYETENLSQLHTYVGHEKKVLSIAFSRDGQWIASGGGDGMKLWHVSGNRSLAHTYVDGDSVRSVAFSSDGQWLAGNYDVKVGLWRVSGDHAHVHTYDGHKSVVKSVALSSDGQWLAAGGYDETVKLWFVSGDRSLAHTYSGEQGESFKSVAFSSDGQWLAAGSSKGTVKLWNVSGDRSLVHTYIGKNCGWKGVESIVFSGDGQWLASSGAKDNSVNLWHASGNRSLAHTYIGHKDEVNNVSFSSNDQWLASGSNDKTVKQWFVSDDHRSTSKYQRDTSLMTSAAFSNDGQWLVYEDGDSVRLSHVTDDRTDKDYRDCYWWQSNGYFEEGVSSITVSADGQWLAAGTPNGTVRLWNASDNRSQHGEFYKDNEGWACSVAISNDGQWLAHDDENTVKLWYVSGDQSLAHIYEHESDVSSVAFSNDNQWLASGTSNGVVKLWNVSGDRSLAHAYTGHDGEDCSLVVFSSDSQWLASGSSNGAVQLWNVSGDRSLAHTYIGHDNEIMSVAFARNGKWLASGNYDGTVRLWSVLTDDCQAVLQSFTGPIWAVTWQPMQGDGSAILCTKGEGSTLCFWRVFSNAGQISKIVLDRISGQDSTMLTATGALIENARNLSPQNTALLRQRDAKQTQISELHS